MMNDIYMSCFMAQMYINSKMLHLSRPSGDMKGDIVVEMKSGDKGNEESGLLNKPYADQVRGSQIQYSIVCRVQSQCAVCTLEWPDITGQWQRQQLKTSVQVNVLKYRTIRIMLILRFRMCSWMWLVGWLLII